jgi:dTDP-4-dehydrorhamnose reductase
VIRTAPQNWQIAATYLTRPIRSDRVAAFALDVRDADAVNKAVTAFQPDIVIHLAALMQGDQMSATNCDGSRHIARAAAGAAARLIHLSSDVIFDGEHAPYTEQDTPNPISPYGLSKALAERAVQKEHPRPIIVRTSLIYGFNPLDPRTHLTITGAMPNLFVDEYRCPIHVDDLATAIVELVDLNFTGILNVAGPQRLSRFEFGLKLAQALHKTPHLTGVSSYSSAAPRPRDCALDISRAKALMHTPLRSVDEVLASNSLVQALA